MLDDLKVSVVMPAYNESAVIQEMLNRVQAVEAVDEIIVVDDGSSDDTQEKVADCPNVRLVPHAYNIGNGAAIKTGIRNATGDIIILMDSDGQHPPEEIPGLLKHIGRYDMVVGARAADSEAALSRNIANTVFNIYASYIVGKRVPDLTSGFRALKGDVARNFVYLLPNGYSYPTTLTIAFFRAGFAVKYHPFTSPARVGVSKVKPLKDGPRFLLTLTRLGVLFVPLKIFLPVSILLIMSGFGYVLSQLVLFSRFSGFGGLIATIGIFIFMLGLISEQIALLRLVNSDR